MSASRASTAAGRRRASGRPAASASRDHGSKAKAKAGTPPRKPAAVRKPANGRKSPASASRATTRARRRPSSPRVRVPRPSLSVPFPFPFPSFGGAGRGLVSAVGSFARPRVLAIIAIAVGALAIAYQLKLRDLPLFSVDKVQIHGLTGPEAGPATQALDDAASKMTTLHVDQAALDAAVAGFPTVVGVSTSTDFPHGLTISVDERPPVLLATQGDVNSDPSAMLPVTGDGSVLPGVDLGDEKLPVIHVDKLPASGPLTGEGLEMALVAGAAPEALQPLIRQVAWEGTDGVQVVLRGGIPLRFGGSERAADKWAAAAAILADPEITSLTYIDLRVPDRPAVGGAAAPPEAPAL